MACVKEAFISSGSGPLDFADDLHRIRPHLFVVNADGHFPEKERLCRELGIEYLVLTREPLPQLPARSTTSLRQVETLPYRIDLAGGWLDQPFVSSLFPGPVLTVSIEPTVSFGERSGMATSTRNRRRELWGPRLPCGEPEQLARVLFAYDNPPGTVDIAGSQDSIGIVVPGLACSYSKVATGRRASSGPAMRKFCDSSRNRCTSFRLAQDTRVLPTPWQETERVGGKGPGRGSGIVLAGTPGEEPVRFRGRGLAIL